MGSDDCEVVELAGEDRICVVGVGCLLLGVRG